MESNEFFRQATLRICGNLEIEKALQQLLIMMTDVMPVSQFFLQKFDRDYNAMRTIAYANLEDCGKANLLTPYPKPPKKQPLRMRRMDGKPILLKILTHHRQVVKCLSSTI